MVPPFLVIGHYIVIKRTDKNRCFMSNRINDLSENQYVTVLKVGFPCVC